MEWNALGIRTTSKRALFGVEGECGVVARAPGEYLEKILEKLPRYINWKMVT